jgi:hypothetical protein
MEGSIKELQESTNHLVEWFPICVDVFFFCLFFVQGGRTESIYIASRGC